ncbi:MAG: mechanosensitive ion channel family protein [Clostridia bacterium]|nr:mechanosensitive ion channel family protein [Clostridia bacterium]
MEALTKTPDESTVEEYRNILQSIDWQTAGKALLILVAGFVCVRLVLHFLKKILKRTGIPATVHTILLTLTRVLLDVVVVLSAANAIGIPVTSFLALLSLVGLAVSLAVQNILSNLAGGILVLGSHPFETGDVIEHDGIAGTVREIRVLHTRVETFDGRMAFIPNSSISSGKLINYTGTGRRRVELSVSASYDSAPSQVRKAVQAAIKRTEGVLEDPEPRVFLDRYGDSAISYTIWLWARNEDFLSVKIQLNELLYDVFAEYGVEMTYPHLQVHLKDR